jgi:hypothetical protein
MIQWQEGASFSAFDLQTAFRPVVEAIGSDRPEWVVLQDFDWDGVTRVYAFRPDELKWAASMVGYDVAVKLALGSQLEAQPALLFGAGEDPLGGTWATGRAIRIDHTGNVEAVGEVVWEDVGWPTKGARGAGPGSGRRLSPTPRPKRASRSRTAALC